MASRILVVDDDKTLCEMLKEGLTAGGYTVRTAFSVAKAWDMLTVDNYDLIVLDLKMPGEDGFDLLRRFRRERPEDTIPVILLTGISAEEDKLQAFELGADDYVVKPFSLKEFIARIGAVLRRYESNLPQEICFGEIRIDRAARIVYRGSDEVKLRLKEYQILTNLAENPGVAISRADLFKAIWGDDSPSGEKTVDVTIHTLRDKVEDNPAEPQYIQTVRGFGYRFSDPHSGAVASD
jgi:two-component system, OmpR family, alkaline phosphatase synthesis response regulator PhoP